MGNTINHKIVQFFLTGDDDLPAVYEVRLIKDTKALICTCPGFKGRSLCKHIKYVKDRLMRPHESSHNHYVLKLEENTPEELIQNASKMSLEEYRSFVTRYGIIEVL